MTKELCHECPNTCHNAQPVSASGLELFNNINCANYTCSFGVWYARHALNRGEFEEVILHDGSITSGVRFGSPDKQTDSPGEFERFVTQDGWIISKNSDMEYFYTGQNIYIR